VVRRLGDIKMQTDYGASSLSQWEAAEFLTSGLYDTYLHGLRKELRKRRAAALRALYLNVCGCTGDDRWTRMRFSAR